MPPKEGVQKKIEKKKKMIQFQDEKQIIEKEKKSEKRFEIKGSEEEIPIENEIESKIEIQMPTEERVQNMNKNKETIQFQGNKQTIEKEIFEIKENEKEIPVQNKKEIEMKIQLPTYLQGEKKIEEIRETIQFQDTEKIIEKQIMPRHTKQEKSLEIRESETIPIKKQEEKEKNKDIQMGADKNRVLIKLTKAIPKGKVEEGTYVFEYEKDKNIKNLPKQKQRKRESAKILEMNTSDEELFNAAKKIDNMKKTQKQNIPSTIVQTSLLEHKKIKRNKRKIFFPRMIDKKIPDEFLVFVHKKSKRKTNEPQNVLENSFDELSDTINEPKKIKKHNWEEDKVKQIDHDCSSSEENFSTSTFDNAPRKNENIKLDVNHKNIQIRLRINNKLNNCIQKKELKRKKKTKTKKKKKSRRVYIFFCYFFHSTQNIF